MIYVVTVYRFTRPVEYSVAAASEDAAAQSACDMLGIDRSAIVNVRPKPTGRGGKRAGAGRPPVPGSKTAVLSIRVSNEAKARIQNAATARGMTTGEMTREWVESF